MTDAQRFEAALRIFLFELDRNSDHEFTPAQIQQIATGSVFAADVLLKELRRENPR